MKALHRVLVYLYILPIKLYKKMISPLLMPACIYTPTCSIYTMQAIEKYGIIRGTIKGALRILRCNPFCKGGYDPLI